jgi:hypothetical protein
LLFCSHQIAIIENGSIVVGMNGMIEAVGPAAEIEQLFSNAVFESVIDATSLICSRIM